MGEKSRALWYKKSESIRANVWILWYKRLWKFMRGLTGKKGVTGMGNVYECCCEKCPRHVGQKGLNQLGQICEPFRTRICEMFWEDREKKFLFHFFDQYDRFKCLADQGMKGTTVRWQERSWVGSRWVLALDCKVTGTGFDGSNLHDRRPAAVGCARRRFVRNNITVNNNL